jgi:hypothetical protein
MIIHNDGKTSIVEDITFLLLSLVVEWENGFASIVVWWVCLKKAFMTPIVLKTIFEHYLNICYGWEIEVGEWISSIY